MRLKHALLPQMCEELTSGDILQEHIQLSTILRQSLKVDLNGRGGTMKGWEMPLRMRYSLEMWSTCCDLISSSFRIIFTQEYLPVALRRTSRTRPKDPELPAAYPRPAPSGTSSP
jgi:hypothetical protein